MLVLALLSATSCATDDGESGEIDEGIDEIRLGVLRYSGESEDVFELPAQITSGEPFVLLIRTYNGACDAQERVDLEYGDAQVVVSPYVRTTIPPGTACPSLLTRLEHTPEITFDVPGEHEILIRGRAVGASVDVDITRAFRVAVE
jgi:hypothetical protein